MVKTNTAVPLSIKKKVIRKSPRRKKKSLLKKRKENRSSILNCGCVMEFEETDDDSIIAIINTFLL